MIRYILPLLLLSLVGCETSTKENSTFFGGKIINPKGKFIVLSDHGKFTDTIALNSDNTFSSTYKNFREGLYYFKHGPEHQYVYIEPKDSILIRLNSWDFDESLVFSGDNAEKNNMLIEVFLDNEIDLKKIYQFSGLSAKAYKTKIDSLLVLKHKKLENYKNQYPQTSERFSNLLEISLTYQPYYNLERFAINNSLKKSPEKLEKNFYNYRANTNNKLDSLMFFYPYNQFVISSLYNDVYRKGLKNNAENITLELLNSIDTNIKNERVKNRLLFNTTVKHFFSETCNIASKKTLYTFFKLSSSIKDKKEIQRLINDTKHVKIGDTLPSFDIIDAKGELHNIANLVEGKKTILYFKNHNFSSDDYVSSRINHLMKKNPTINFLIVNSCKDSGCFTKKVAIKNQLRLAHNSKAREFLTSKFSRMVLIDENGIIKNGYSSLSSEKLNEQIADLQK